MTEAEIRQAYLDELVKVAPDIDLASVEETEHLQEDLELDSMDILNFVTALHKRLGVDIPEQDYPRIATLTLGVSYLSARLT